MEKHIVKIKSISEVTHDVLRFELERPKGYNFKPGQATDVSINKDGWRDEKRPFTFTNLPDAGHLEFTTKTYPERNGVTNQLRRLEVGDEWILHKVFGTINYKDEGIFIAGGAGVTPFIAILRDLHRKNEIGNNKLIFANKTSADIINKEEFENMLGDNFINILSDEETGEYAHGFVTKDFLKKYMDDTVKNVYICGPQPMLDSLNEILPYLNVAEDAIVREEF